VLRVYPENALLAAVIVVVAGLLPNLDAGGSGPAREISGLVAAAIPMILMETIPAIRAGGITRVAIVVVIAYLGTRWIIVRFFDRFSTHRGMLHSVPAAIITAEIVYLMFYDLRVLERMFVAFAAFIGYFMHLMLDGYENVALLPKGEKKPKAMKIKGASWASTWTLYGVMLVLGWFVLQDVFPRAQIVSPIAL
jgi:hypothetical protein